MTMVHKAAAQAAVSVNHQMLAPRPHRTLLAVQQSAPSALYLDVSCASDARRSPSSRINLASLSFSSYKPDTGTGDTQV
jgi:hypothetical protein